MVCPERSRASEGESDSERELMERSKRLHNFELPCLWGRQRFLRCVKLDEGSGDKRARFAGGDSSSSGSRRREEEDPGFRRRPNRVSAAAARDSNPIRAGAAAAAARSRIDEGEEGIEAVREKLTLDLKTAATKMKDAILGKTAEEDHAAPPPPWNLRTRRAACKEPPTERRSTSYSPPRIDGGPKPEKDRPKFVVGLSRKEIEDDFAAILGQRPPRRPKKRAKIVQKQLDSLFPGLWLTEVSEDMYKVAENPDNGKRQ